MNDLPITVRRSIELVGIVAAAFVVSVGSNVIAPILMAIFIGILLQPMYRFFKKMYMPEVVAIFLSILLTACFVGGIIYFFYFQVSSLIRDLPNIERNLNIHWHNLSEWLNRNAHFSTEQQLSVLQDQSNKMLQNTGLYLQTAFASLSSIFIFVGLLPIYIFLTMYYKNLLLRFIFCWFKQDNYEYVVEAVKETEAIIKSYLLGLLIQVTYMTVLLGVLLLVFGIKHALLIAIIFAILNLIPYVGALIGNLIGILLTLTSSQNLVDVVIVLAVIAAVQFLDNNILMPRIVGSKVKINALASIVGVIIGGALAGITGMFLSLPVIAILKIVFDRSSNLKHWGLLFGDERPDRSPLNFPSFRLKRR